MTVRVAICEDSGVYAHGLRRLIETGGELEVVTVAPSAEELMVELVRTPVDIVTMDLELPGLGGVEAIRRIMRRHPVPIVVLSAHAGRSSRLVAESLDAGALEAFAKADVELSDRDGPAATALRRRLLRLAEHRPDAGPHFTTRPAPETSPPPARARRSSGARPVTAIGIVSSAGGPGALRKVLSALPSDFPLPVLVVQHIGDGFTEGLVDWLHDVLAVPVRLARHGEPSGRGVAVGPAGSHLLLGPDGCLCLDEEGHPGPYRPSGDVLLSSIASSARRGGLGIVLSGMGRDGAEGVVDLLAAGAAAWAQAPGEAAVWGMPAAAVQAGATSRSLAAIGGDVAALATRAPR